MENNINVIIKVSYTYKNKRIKEIRKRMIDIEIRPISIRIIDVPEIGTPINEKESIQKYNTKSFFEVKEE